MRAPNTQLFIHLVWSTWEREPLITEEIRPRLYAAISQSCVDLKCSPLALGGMADHVHLLVRLHPTVAIADLVQKIKGTSSHLVNHDIRPGGTFRWQGAYGAFSIRLEEVEQVTGYIRNQPSHHAHQTLVPSFEVSETIS